MDEKPLKIDRNPPVDIKVKVHIYIPNRVATKACDNLSYFSQQQSTPVIQEKTNTTTLV